MRGPGLKVTAWDRKEPEKPFRHRLMTLASHLSLTSAVTHLLNGYTNLFRDIERLKYLE